MNISRGALLFGVLAAMGSVAQADCVGRLYLVVKDENLLLVEEDACAGFIGWPKLCQDNEYSFVFYPGEDGNADSVKWFLDGEVVRCESTFPYTLFGNSGNNFEHDYFGRGVHTLRAEMYPSTDDCTGDRSATFETEFEVIECVSYH